MTALYQQREPTKSDLDEDRQRLLDWLSAQGKAPRKKGERIWSSRAEDFVQELILDS